MKLVIVESPTKAKTISKYLSNEYKVVASYGHVVDLPKKQLGVDLENNFTPSYEVTLRGKKTLAELKKLAKEATEIYIATDPDREGEAIGWNILNEISPKSSKVERITFHEITKEAINEAFKHATTVNTDLVDAQQARRVLDRLVGYKLSPLLWKKVRYGLSAGRVQSVAVRLIVERERERKAFTPQEYWGFEGVFALKIVAQLKKIDNKDFLIDSKEKSDQIVTDIKQCEHKVASVETKEVKKYPHPPFTTSTLQQSASNLYGFSAKRTMSASQKLFEMGLITYHRTDSCNLAPAFVESARAYIKTTFGANFIPEKPVFYKTKAKSAQEAHEAIRPTRAENSNLSKLVKLDQLGKFDQDLEKIYNLIWRRAVSCQMVPALYDQRTIRIESKKKKIDSMGYYPAGVVPPKTEEAREYLFVNSEQVLKFAGFLFVYHSSVNLSSSQLLSNIQLLSLGQILNLTSLTPSQHFTQPPARYQTASLIKVLEEYGVGRPSTYASIITTIESRGYVLRDGRYFYPDDVAFVVVDLLVANFPEIVGVKFTAGMEENLDKIALGKLKWVPVIREFWDPFLVDLTKADANLKKTDFTTLAQTEEKCPDCGANLVVKLGRYGKFLSCGKFPECKFMKAIIEETGHSCPDCKDGRVIVRRTKKGKTFYGCSKYPDCKWASWDKPVTVESPKSP